MNVMWGCGNGELRCWWWVVTVVSCCSGT